jgi:hypothetical protein
MKASNIQSKRIRILTPKRTVLQTHLVDKLLEQYCHNLLNLLTTLLQTIEILDLECVLGHVTGVQIENKNALINPPFCGDKIITEKR